MRTTEQAMATVEALLALAADPNASDHERALARDCVVRLKARYDNPWRA